MVSVPTLIQLGVHRIRLINPWIGVSRTSNGTMNGWLTFYLMISPLISFLAYGSSFTIMILTGLGMLSKRAYGN